METLRTSSYLIPVRLEDEKDKYMLIHGYTGAIDVVNKEVVDFLQINHSTTTQMFPFGDNLRKRLIQRGYLTIKTEEEEYKYVERLALALHKRNRLTNTQFTFVVTYNCNFECPYCFERFLAGTFDTPSHFSKEMVDRAYQAISEIQPQKDLCSKSIALFGGEPLLAENKELVTYIVKKGFDLGFRFHAVTNGYDLHEYQDLLNETYFTHIQITIDGIEDRHNQKRIHKKRFPTFERIVQNIDIALKNNVGVTIRVNTDRNNIHDLKKLEKKFEDLGYTSNPKFSMDSAVLRNYDESLSEQEKQRFYSTKDFVDTHKEIKFKYGCKTFGAYQNIYRAITKGKPLQYRSTFCGAQSASYVFDPFGRIYPCWDFIGTKEHEIGNYSYSPISWNEDRLKRWHNHDITSVDSCRKCKYALLCGGGCFAHNINVHRCENMSEIIKYSANMAFNNLKFKENEDKQRR